MALPQARHDALFRLLVSDPGHAGRLLRDYLPPEVVSRLDPEHPPVHVEGTAIDGEGSRTQSDAIFRLRLRDLSTSHTCIGDSIPAFSRRGRRAPGSPSSAVRAPARPFSFPAAAAAWWDGNRRGARGR